MHSLAFLNLKPLPIGIDLGSSGMRLLQLQRVRGGLAASAAARIDLSEAADQPDSDARIQAICETLRVRLATREFHGRECVVSLDDRLLRVRSIRQPRMPDDEVERAAALDAPGRLGFPEAVPAEVGWVRAGEVRQGDEFRDEIILVGTARAPVERLVMGLASIGLRPIAVEPGFISAARAYSRTLRRAEDQDTIKVVAHIGMLTTGISIIRGQHIAFHKPVEIGGQAMTKAAAERLNLPIDSIIDLRRQRMAGAPIDPRVDRAIFEAIRPTIMDIANEISLCIRYFSVSFRGCRVEECILSGGNAPEPQMAELIGETLHVPTSQGHPLGGIDTSRVRSAISETQDAPWAVAAGLAMRALRGARSNAPGLRRRADPAAKEAPQPDAARRVA